MKKSLCLAAALCVLGGIATSAMAQTSQPTKTAPVQGISTTWKQGLSYTDIQRVNSVTRGKSSEDKWMVWTAIVRNREASRDIYPEERMTPDRVLANVRVRMSTEESQRWTTTWSHLTSWDRQAMITVLTDDLRFKH